MKRNDIVFTYSTNQFVLTIDVSFDENNIPTLKQEIIHGYYFLPEKDQKLIDEYIQYVKEKALINSGL